MGLTSEIFFRYKSAATAAKAPYMLVYKKTERGSQPVRLDMRRISGELVRVTRPLVIAEARKLTADLGAVQRKNSASLQRQLELERAKNSASGELMLARLAKRAEDYGEKLLAGFAVKQELILAAVSSKQKLDAKTEDRPIYPGERPASLKDVEGILEKRLSEAEKEILGGTKRIARAEAEAVFRGFREEEEYQRLR